MKYYDERLKPLEFYHIFAAFLRNKLSIKPRVGNGSENLRFQCYT